MDNYVKIQKNKKFNMAGEEYQNGITMNLYLSNDIFFLTNLKKEYSELQFTVGHIDGTDMGNATLSIYLDDKLYQSYSVPCDGMPEVITIPVTGVTQLKAIASKESKDPVIGLVDIKIK